MIRRPPRSTLFPTRRSSDLIAHPTYNYFQPFLPNSEGPWDSVPPMWQASTPPIWRLLGFDVSLDRKSTRLNSSHGYSSYAFFSLKKKNRLVYLTISATRARE